MRDAFGLTTGERGWPFLGRILRRASVLGLLLLLSPQAALAWWNPAWGLRRKILINNGAQATTLSSFTVLVRLDSTRVEYFRTQDSGQDIRFVDADDTTQLAHEIERWDEAGSSYVWVRIPVIDGGSNADFFWMYYDNPAAADGQNVNGTWDTEFKMVHHLNEPAGGPASHTDSTSNNNHSNQINVQAPQGGFAGQIAGADSFSAGALDDVEIADNATLDVAANESVTVEAWIRTGTSGTFQEILAKDECCVPTASGWDFLVWSGNQARFSVYDDSLAAVATAQGGAVTDNQWHYLVGRWNRGTRTAQVFVDGVSVATNTNATLGGSAFSNSRQVRIGEESDSDPEGGFNFNGLIDEVRLSKVVGPPRSDDWIRAQNLSMRDLYLTFVLAECPSVCQGLTATEGSGLITVTSANAFELVFANAAGGHLQDFYDLAESPVKDAVHDLAGGPSNQVGLFIDEVSWAGPTPPAANYRSDKNPAVGRGQVVPLEVTPTRVVVRSSSYFGSGSAVIPGLKGVGDWSVYPAGRVALHWNRISTQPVPITWEQVHLNVHFQSSGVLSTWSAFTKAGPLCMPCTTLVPPTPPDFLLFQNEQSQARTDFLQILGSNWPRLARIDTGLNTTAGQEWGEHSWNDTVGHTIPADLTESWDILTYFKPTVFTDGADPAVTSRSDDYRIPDDLSGPTPIAAGAGWFDPSENTSAPSDFFNEKDASYDLDLDPVAGLTFDMDGNVTPRIHPFFKIRQWRSINPPATISLEGAILSRDVDYKADMVPVARAGIHKNLIWHSTLEDAAAVTSPDVGSPGTLAGSPTFQPARFGQGARLSASGDWIAVPTAGNFTAAKGSLSFWFRAGFDSTDALLHDICGFFTNGNNFFVLEKRADNSLYFTVRSNGAPAVTLQVTPANYAWLTNEWVHIQLDWDDSLGLTTQLRLFFGDREPTHVDPGADYDATGLVVAPEFRFGNTNADVDFAPGLYDEIEIISDVTLLARAGLLADTREFLADPTRNASLDFMPVDPNRRGRYVNFSADVKFHGLNIALATPGAGVPADALEWQYWNGTTWASLETVPGFKDTTNSLTRSGNVYWTADPPGWVPYSIFGGVEIFRIRVYLPAGFAYTTFPVEALVRTDVALLQYCGNITLANQTFVINAPVPTAVALESFSAAPGNALVDLSWTTASELQNLGFHLYRADAAEGPYTRITTSLIPGLGSSPTGQSYSFRDGGLTNGRTYFYELEDVETTGRTERHGPVSATPADGPGPGTPPASGASETAYGDPSSVVLKELERSPDHVVLELRTGGFWASPAAGGRHRLRIPGFASASRPGEPSLPARRALVPATAGRRIRLASILASDERSFPGVRPEPEGQPVVETGEEGTIRAIEEERAEGAAFGRAYPAEWARLLGGVFQAETKKAELLLFPLRWQGGQLVLASRLVVRLEFTGTDADETSRGGSSGRRRLARPSHARGESGVLAQLRVQERGLQRVAYEEIFDDEPGRRGRGIPASSLRLARQGTSVAFHVEPEGRPFGPGSSLYFLSEGPSLNPYGDAVYELEAEATGRSLRMEVQDGLAGSDRVAEYLATETREENHYYQAGLLEAPELWLWDVVVSPGRRSFPFTVSELAASSTPGRLRVAMQGASDFEGVADHHVRARVNGVPVGEILWDGKRAKTLEAALETGVLHEGTNTLELEDVGDAGAAYSMVFLDRFAVTYPRRLEARDGTLEGRFASSGRADVAGLSSSAFVLDITDAPRWRKGATAISGGVAIPVEGGRSYFATSVVGRPAVTRPSSALRNGANRADYLLVGPRSFLDAARPLLDLRESQGLATKAVALEDVFEQFGFGEASPEAVKEFLEYAYHLWAGPPVRYVLLLGDASYDPRDYLGTGTKDWLPGFPVRTSYLWTVSDPAYASVNGDDLLPDLAIGRLPAASVAEAARLVEKIVAFESRGGNLEGPAVLVADNPDLAGNFEADADEIARTVLASRSPRKIYYSREGAGTRARIEEAFDEGASLLSYVGHGGTAVWASENIFNGQDVASLRAQARQPLLLTLNCLNGFFHFPPLNSLSEELLKAEGKGAIGAFSPTGLSVNEAAHLLHETLLEEVVSGRHERLGDAILAAQVRYAESGALPELISIYHLLGDPALRIR